MASMFAGLEIISSCLHMESDVDLPRNTSGHIADLTCDEESPSVGLLTLLCQLLQIEELTYGTSPSCEQHLVQQPILLTCYDILANFTKDA